MNLLSKIICSLVVLSSFTMLKAQTTTITQGTLLSLTDSTPVGQAHIINLTAKNGVISNNQGNFALAHQATDSISISSIGYKTIHILAKELSSTIYLQERNYQLELFNVMPYKTFKEFKDAFVNLELRDTVRPINSSIYLSKEALVQAFNEAQTGIIIPLDFSSFSKRAKDKANYEMLLLHDEYEAFLASKFNPELVAKITELNNTDRLKDFIAYCDFTNEFIANNNNYDIITQTFECYDEYISLPLASK